MQHLAAAASRARYLRRRERQRASGLGPSELLIFTSSSSSQETNVTSPEDFQNLSYGSPEGSPTSGVNVQPQSSADVNLGSTTAVNRDFPFRPRYYKRLFHAFVFINCTSCGMSWFFIYLKFLLLSNLQLQIRTWIEFLRQLLNTNIICHHLDCIFNFPSYLPDL